MLQQLRTLQLSTLGPGAAASMQNVDLGPLTQLSCLTLCQVTDSLALAGTVASLTRLSCKDPVIENNQMAAARMHRLTQLQEVHLEHVQLNSLVMQCLGLMPGLQDLFLRGLIAYPDLAGEAFSQALGQLTGLIRLRLCMPRYASSSLAV